MHFGVWDSVLKSKCAFGAWDSVLNSNCVFGVS